MKWKVGDKVIPARGYASDGGYLWEGELGPDWNKLPDAERYGTVVRLDKGWPIVNWNTVGESRLLIYPGELREFDGGPIRKWKEVYNPKDDKIEWEPA